VAKRAVEREFDLAIPEERRSFFYMPFMHSENLADQDTCIRLLRERMTDAADSLRYAERHREAIARFGRFPARNRALGRIDTPEEAAFLVTNPSGF
jgi:uncharacterized protein (DUF924 family)